MKKIIKRAIGASFLLIGATLMMNFLSCKKETDGGGTTTKDFEVEYIKVWGSTNLVQKDKVTVSGSAEDKTLEVVVKNCNDYKLEYELNDKKDSKETDSGKVKINPFDIERGKSDLTIKLIADGYNKKVFLIEIRREDSTTDVKVMLKRTEDAVPVEVVDGKNYPTSGDKATVSIVSTGKAEFETVTIAGSDIPINDTNKKKVEKTDVATGGNVEVKATFKYYKDSITNFSLEKVAPGEVPVRVLQATVSSGNGYATKKPLTFADENGIPTASVELEDIEYSCVKLEMETDLALKADESGLQECKDERSPNYSTNPTQNDVKGIFSGRLIKEMDKDGKVTTEYNEPIVGKKLTEYLIVGAGTVEYKFKLKADGRKETECVVKITNKSEKKVVFAGNDAQFYASQGYGNQSYLNGPPVWRWTTYSQLPVNSDESWKKITNLEYMGDIVKMIFAKINAGVEGDMYFYYNVFDDANSKKHEFARIIGEPQGGAYFTQAIFNPEEKYVDAFVAFKAFLPQALLPLQTQKKWQKIVDKGFLFQIENDLEYSAPTQQNPNAKESSLEIFYDAFNYRVQAKTYEAGNALNIGLQQDYAEMLNGTNTPIKHPFLDGGKKTDNSPNDLMFMVPTFAGKIGDSIASVKYTIKKNGVEENDWKDVTITASKLSMFLCLNAKDVNITDDGKLKDRNTLYVYEKDSSNENNYEIEVTITPKTGNTETFKYKIDYKNKQTVTPMSLENSPSTDSNLFGVPTSYAEYANREVQAMFREMMAQDYVRASLISR